jgi:hypothetical protein
MLPLAVLLKLTLLFPDGAPSRYQMARAANNPHRLRELAAGRSPQSRAAAEVLAWVAELARHDRHTRGHSERVRVFADLLAEQLNLTRIEKDKLRWASLLHDVGKLQVPARILNKPAKPNLSEWEVLRRHPAAGMELVGPLAEWLGPWAGGIADHHERFDGTGYPNGLSGTDISLAGRIVAVADSYETMTAVRPYKRAMAAAAGRAELARCAGSHFDPAIVRAFLNIGLPRMLYGIGPISFLFHFPFLGRLPEAGLSLMSVASQAAAPVAAGLTAGAVATATVVSPTASAGAVGHQPVTGSGRVAAAASSSTPLAGPALSLGLDRMTEIASAPSTFAAGSVPDPVIRAGHGGAAPAPGTNGAPASGGTGTRAGKGAAGGSSSGSGNPGNGNSGNSNSGNSNSGKSSSSKGSSGNSGSGKANSGNSGNGNSGSHSSGGTATTPGQTKTKTNTGSAGGHKTGASGTGATTGSSSSTPPTSPGHSKRSNAVGGSSGPGPSGSSSASHGKAHSTAG